MGQLIKLIAQLQTNYRFQSFSSHSLFNGEYQLPFSLRICLGSKQNATKKTEKTQKAQYAARQEVETYRKQTALPQRRACISVNDCFKYIISWAAYRSPYRSAHVHHLSGNVSGVKILNAAYVTYVLERIPLQRNKPIYYVSIVSRWNQMQPLKLHEIWLQTIYHNGSRHA